MVIEHALNVVFHACKLLGRALGQNIGLVLELSARSALSLDFGITSSLQGLLEFGAGRLEQIRLVLDIRFGSQTLLGKVDIVLKNASHGFHDCDGLWVAEAAPGEIQDKRVGIKIVDVRRGR